MDRLKRKGQWMKNPLTGRPIKIGATTWRRLVKDGVIKGKYADDEYVYELNEKESIEDQKRRFNNQLPKGLYASKGTGIYSGKLMVRRSPLYKKVIRKLKAGELSDETTDFLNQKISDGTFGDYVTNVLEKAFQSESDEPETCSDDDYVLEADEAKTPNDEEYKSDDDEKITTETIFESDEKISTNDDTTTFESDDDYESEEDSSDYSEEDSCAIYKYNR